MLKTARFLLPYALTALPVVALAQFTNLRSSFQEITNIINGIVIPLIVGVAGVMFMYGLIQYVTNQGDEASRSAARQTMIWGIVVLFVMISVWGLVNILVGTFNFNNTLNSSNIPQVPNTTY